MARAVSLQPVRQWDLRAERITRPLVAGVVAALLAWMLFAFGPPGGDAATHLYQTRLVSRNGLQFWDNLWYSGRYSLVNYTLLYYPLAVAVGQAVVVVTSVGAATAAFARLVRTEWPRLATAPVIAATLVFPLAVIAGVYPFLLGLAFGLLMLAAVQAHRIWLASLLALFALAAHVLAFGFVGLFLVAWALADHAWLRDRGYRAFAVVLCVAVLVQALLLRAFSLPGGRYLFDPKDLAAILVFCAAGAALSYRVPAMRAMWIFFWLYAALTLVDFAIPNAIGGNMVRLIALAGLPLLLIPLGAHAYRPGWVAAVCIALIAVWQGISPVTEWRASAASPGQNAAFWTPAIAFLAAHGDPDYRVEVVQSKRYWEAYYIAGHGYAIARGWYRQDDYPTNAVLYNSPTAAPYQAWLRSVGVRYVLLQSGTLDFTSEAEAALLRSGTSGLQPIARTGSWSVYELPNPTPIVTPADAARVTRITPTTITIQATRPALLTVRVHDTPYWTIQSRDGSACVAAGTGSTTPVAVRHAGTVELRFVIRPASIMRALLGARTSCTPVPAP
jgi:hypothetical protein